MQKMKDSGIEWIGKIPESWSVDRLQAHLEEMNISNDPIITEQVLSLTNKLGVVPYEEKGNQGNKAKMNFAEYKVAFPNTIVVNSMNVLIGSVGLCKQLGCVSPVYYIYQTKGETDLRYYNYIFQVERFQKELRRYANGILEIRLRISSKNLLSRSVPCVPYELQTKIADYLDKKCEVIDSLVVNEKAMIDKLNEYKKSIITEAVTKGIDKSVPLKDSGVEWIGKIPKSWRLMRMKHVALINPTVSINLDSNQEISYVPMECLKNGYIIPKTIKTSEINSGLTSFCNGDIIMAKVTPCFENGNIAFVDNLIGGYAVGSSELFVLRPKFVNPQWLVYFLQNAYFTDIAKSTMTGTGGLKRVSPTFLKNYKFFLPNKIDQQKIVDYLDKKCAVIDKLIELKKAKIDKLGEYKKSIIYEYVTGKKQVV